MAENNFPESYYTKVPTEGYINIASFEYPLKNIPLKDVEVTISPQQDLHGYDSPWPAGGGANKLPPQNIIGSMSSVIVSSDGDAVMLNGTADAYGQVISSDTFTLDAGTYYLQIFIVSGSTSGGSVRYQLRSVDGTITYANTSSGVAFTLSEQITIQARVTYTSGTIISNLKIRVMVSSGSTAPDAFAPYSNICPITGWNGVNVSRTGKNMLPVAEDKTHQGVKYVVNPDGSVTVSQTATGNSLLDIGRDNLVLQPGTYSASISGSNATVTIFKIVNGTASVLRNGVGSFTLTEPTSVFLRLSFSSGTTASGTAYPQIELGSTATAYEPYAGATYPVSFGNAGTVYGGTVDVTTGVLTVDKILFEKNSSTMNNSENYPGWKNAGIRQYGIATNVYNNALMSVGKQYSVNTNGTTNDILFLGINTYQLTQSEWQALAVDVQIVIPIDTPLIYQLTPTEISTLLGVNNVWADTGNISLKYLNTGHVYFKKDDDIIQENILTYGSIPECTADVTKDKTEDILYLFNDWNPEIHEVNSSLQTYTAQYEEINRNTEITDNYKYIPGVWDDRIRVIAYNRYKNYNKCKNIDVTGYIDRDIEKVLSNLNKRRY